MPFPLTIFLPQGDWKGEFLKNFKDEQNLEKPWSGPIDYEMVKYIHNQVLKACKYLIIKYDTFTTKCPIFVNN